MGVSSSSQALVMPSMVCENCHMMCGFSGLPKFRQLVAAIGRRARASHVARRLRHRMHGAELGIEIAPAAVAVERHRQAALRAFHANHAAFAARALDRVGLHHGVVLLEDPALGADIRAGQQTLQLIGEFASSRRAKCSSGTSRGTGGSQRSSGR